MIVCFRKVLIEKATFHDDATVCRVEGRNSTEVVVNSRWFCMEEGRKSLKVTKTYGDNITSTL